LDAPVLVLVYPWNSGLGQVPVASHSSSIPGHAGSSAITIGAAKGQRMGGPTESVSIHSDTVDLGSWRRARLRGRITFWPAAPPTRSPFLCPSQRAYAASFGLSLSPNPKPGGRSPGPGAGSLAELAPGGLRSRAGHRPLRTRAMRASARAGCRLLRTRARRASVPGRASVCHECHLPPRFRAGGVPGSPGREMPTGATFTWSGAAGGSRSTRHRSAS